jgi:3-deoxy-D-manno-octulosonate 8-phosphate phosphatase (KDO 8-P phosphatase)
MEDKAAAIELLFLDVDGVLTDGRITLNEKGEEIKSFDVKDGLGLKLLMKDGIEIVIVTGRRSRVVAHRAKELGIREVYQGVSDKRLICRRLIEKRGFDKSQVGSVGDDLPDLAMFQESGLCITVADAAREVREQADFIASKRGGMGAVREISEWMLKCRGRWPRIAFTDQSRG